MRKWRRWSVAICLLALPAGGCATWPGQSSALHPVPAALDWPEYDIFPMANGAKEYSLRSEMVGTARLGETWSQGAVTQRDAFWARVLRDRCAAREALQIANGGKAEPDGVCRPQR